ncbi:butyrophilin subfamily 1 member A1-like isoform X2 [Poecilia latipinna]|uniref:butyrophilin subfamily 1 member A1-like isoform X2 n=1 Tax=Poecilia latipinna TaxID=48699 RepID=UPI00072EDD4A|nr:PREDICTED: butyrophilin subfamily 1 member A1-like isoform X2 [Poecilia latipinna]
MLSCSGFLLNLLFLWLKAVWSADVDVSCVYMESCVLPCRFHSSREIHIHWVQLKARPVPVRSFHSNQSQQDQDQRFRGRASLFWDQISRGNASLLLKGVKVQDEGRYECFTSSSAANSHSFINLMVDAPVTELKIEATGNRMSCSSEGIYPSPEHSWSFRASSNTTVQSAIRVSRTAEQRYDINSSLMLSEGVSFLTFSCSFSTRRSSRKVTVFTPVSVSVPEAEVTINCSAWNLTVTRLVWRFNGSRIVLSRNRTDGGHSVTEAWRKHVKAVTASGGLTLRGLTAQQEGLYSCEMSNEEEAVISGTMLSMQKHPVPGSSWVPAAVGAAAAVASLTGTSAFLLLRFLKSQRTV